MSEQEDPSPSHPENLKHVVERLRMLADRGDRDNVALEQIRGSLRSGPKSSGVSNGEVKAPEALMDQIEYLLSHLESSGKARRQSIKSVGNTLTGSAPQTYLDESNKAASRLEPGEGYVG